MLGAFYFDGWADSTTNFHFAGLFTPQFKSREPLYGWRDNALETMRTQLTWAHQDGIGFFVFDWYSDAHPDSVLLNHAHDNYLRLKDHQGVGYALLYVNQDPFVVTPAKWPQVVEGWVTRDFTNPDYVRIQGKPLLIIIDERGFTLQMGGAAGVNLAIDELQAAARRHGLPGVFVVGGKYLDWNTLHYDCFPSRCNDTDPAFVQEHYDAITQYGYSTAIEPKDGERSFAAFTQAEEQLWGLIAAHSPFPYIPSIIAGWDPRPIAYALGPDPTSGYPWQVGHLFWTRGSPAQVAGTLRDGIDWANTHPSLGVEPAPAPPMVLIEAWNEISEGSWVLPTAGEGYAYGEAVARALGLPWQTTHTRHLTIASTSGRTLSGLLTVDDGWSPCDATRLNLQRKSSRGWLPVRSTTARPGGGFTTTLPRKLGAYSVVAPRARRYRQTCDAATSATLLRHR